MTDQKYRGWTPQEISKLRREYGTKNTAKLADELGRTKQSVQTRARLMGLRKETAANRERFLDKVMTEYATATAAEIAARYCVSVHAVRMWIREARYGYWAARQPVRSHDECAA